jgi:hypothetical protein
VVGLEKKVCQGTTGGVTIVEIGLGQKLIVLIVIVERGVYSGKMKQIDIVMICEGGMGM